MKSTNCRARCLHRAEKRILSIIISLAMLLSITAGLDFSAYASTLPRSGSCGDNVTYTFNSLTGLLTISGNGAMTNWNNNSSSSAYYTKNPFYNQSAIKTVVINSGVESIGDYVFYNCTGLTSVTIPDSVTSIGSSAFRGCTGLTSITIPDRVSSIGNYAFYGCKGLTSVTIPDSVSSIGNSAFSGCTGLTSVTIGNSVTSIGFSAFGGCSGLTNIEMPNSVTSIGNSAFYSCTGLKTVIYRGTQTEWNNISIGLSNSELADARKLFSPKGQQGTCGSNLNYTYTNSNGVGVLTISGTGSMTNYSSGSESPFCNLCVDYLIIKDGVSSIGDYAFYNCTGLTSVTIPDNVSSIGDSAFSGCTGLTSVTIPDSVRSIGSSAFYDCKGLTKVNISSIEAWCKISFSSETSNPLFYAHNLYSDNELITDLVIPDNVSSIGKYAFSGWKGLTSITIPDSVSSIGNSAFYNCTGLTSVTIGNSVSSIGSFAFRECTGLTSITIPDSVLSIGEEAFSGCTGIKELKMPCSAKIYNSQYTFAYCKNIEKVTLTKGTGTMQNYSSSTGNSDTYYLYTPWYISREKFKELIIEDGITSIGNNAFRGCTGLTSITIPDSVLSIGEEAFYNCTGLTKVNISSIEAWYKISFSSETSNPLYYAHNLYSDNELITDLVIPDNVSSIGKYAFSGCTGLTSITIPDSVSSIGNSAFSGCTGLTKVNISSIEAWCKISFSSEASNPLYYAHNLYSDNELITDLVIPDNVSSIGNYAFSGCTGLTSITIPDSVSNIGNYAFNSCSGLKTVELGTGIKTVSLDTFADCSEIETVYLYSKQINSTQNIAAQMPKNSTLYAYASTDAEIYCSIYGVEFKALEGLVCELGHHDYELIIINPTCEENGIKKYQCRFCDEYYEENIPALGHKEVIDEAVLPTCTETGLTEGSHCSVCGKVLVAQEAVNANGHSYVAVVTAPTCKEQGYKTYTCSICGDKYTEAIDKAAHTPEADLAVAPTCTKSGLTAGSHCSVCGKVLVAQKTVSANGHKEKVIKGTPATFKTAGKTDGKKCSVCGKVLVAQKTVAKLGAPALSKVTAGKKQFKASWKSVKSIDGYQIQYSTSSSFKSGNKTVTVSGYKSTSKTVKSLKAKKKYYVRIRAYKTINGKKQYSAWSKSKSVTTKK